jgi:hypothetical protein
MHVRFHLSRRDSVGTVILVEGCGGFEDQLDASNLTRLVLFWCVALSRCRYYYFALPPGPFVLFCSLLLSLPLEPFYSGAGSSLQLGKPKYFDSENSCWVGFS